MKIVYSNPPSNKDFSLVILAGGRSSRMGRDKCYLPFKGKTFLEHQIQLGLDLGIEDILVSGKHTVDGIARSIPDNICGRGPLGGLEACLREAKNQQCIVICVDSPFITKEMLQYMIRARRNSQSLAMCCQHHGQQEPLCGIYDRSLVEDMLEELKFGKGKTFNILNRIGCDWLNMDAYDACFMNINKSEDYDKYVLSGQPAGF